MTPNTVRLHRVIRTAPQRVYRAFLDADALAKWLPPDGFTGHVHQLDARVGGAWRMSFTHFGSGRSHSFGGTYLELVPGERLVYTSAFDDPQLPGEMRTTVTLEPVFCGTSFSVEQAGIPDAIPIAACHLGWQESVAMLMRLVEPEIPG